MTTDPSVTDLRREVRSLEGRVFELETALVRFVMATASALLVAGLVLPFVHYTHDGEERSFALAWAAIQATAEGALSTDGIVVVIILCLPALVSILALASLAGHGVHRDAGRRRTFDTGVGALLFLSTLGVGALVLLARSTAEVDDPVGPAIWLYVPGAIAVAWLLSEQSARRWWDAGR